MTSLSNHGASSNATARAALLIEGGGLRGAFSAGVLAELSKPDSPKFDDIVAVSSAAPSAAYMVTGQIEAGLKIWTDFTHGTQLISPFNLLKGRPLLDIDRLVRLFEQHIVLDTERLTQANSRLWVVVTNCHTGKAEYVRATKENAFALIKATMALPIAYGRVVDVAGTPYIDGGVADAVPAKHTLGFGHDRTVLILTQPPQYRRKRSRTSAKIIARSYASYPEIAKTIAVRWQTSNASLELVDELESMGKIDVIRPHGPLAASRLSTSRRDICATLEAGRIAGRAWVEQVRRRAASQPSQANA
ncbi:MAG: patatin family protein [Polyangiaceae bacterium]